MIIDASALVAILWGEPDAQLFSDAIEADPICRLSAATFLEVAIVVDRRHRPTASRRLDDVITEAAIFIEPVTEVQARNRELTESLEQQTATGEILRAISASPTDAGPVFEAMVASATRLCDASFSAVARVQDGRLHLVALNNMSAEETAAFHALFPRPLGRNFAMGRAVVDGRPVHFEDVLAELDYDARTRETLQSVLGYRTFLGVPIVRDGRPIGSVRFDRRGSEAEISITVDPTARGGGLGRRMIAETSELELAARPATQRIVAVVRASNERSHKAFTRAGFRLDGRDDGVDPLLMLVRERMRSPR